MSISRLSHLVLLTCLWAGSTHAADSDWVQLFNGKDLTGWDGQPGAWTVRDGAIHCTGKAQSRNWLIWRGGQPGDFELRLKFRFGKGNSGVQVRSQDLGKWQVQGYQVEVAAREKMGLWHHSLMGKDDPAEMARKTLALAGQRVVIQKDAQRTTEQVADAETVQAAFRENDWNDMVVIARGPRLVQKLNGVVLAELVDRQEGFARPVGVVALQDHGKGTEVAFKDIRLRESRP